MKRKPLVLDEAEELRLFDQHAFEDREVNDVCFDRNVDLDDDVATEVLRRGFLTPDWTELELSGEPESSDIPENDDRDSEIQLPMAA